MSWQDLLNLFDEDSAVFEGKIAENASGPSDAVMVTIPAHDRSQKFGPAPWMPRVVEGAGGLELDLPNKGDRCIVALAETDEPGQPEVWIIAWWPYD